MSPREEHPVTHGEADAALDAVAPFPDGARWRREGDELVLERTLADFPSAIAFVDAVAGLAEAADHHPDIDVRWRTVVLRLTTHSAGGLTGRDVDLAREIAGLA